MRKASNAKPGSDGQHAATRGMSRRRFVGTTAGAAGAVLGTWLWVPLLTRAGAQTTPPTPTPVPGTTPTPVPKPKVLIPDQGSQFFLEFPPPVGSGDASFTTAPTSPDPVHPNAIQLLEAALGMEHPATIGAATGVAQGKANFEALRIIKNVDQTSPDLLALCGQNRLFSQVNMFVRLGGGSDDDIVYRFKMVKINRVNLSADIGSDAPQETVTFVFGALQIEYGAASSGPPMTAAWSVVKNQPVFDIGQ